MQIIKHRINTIAQLKELPPQYGAEIDIRYHNSELIIEHDPLIHHLSNPVFLRDWLKNWRHQGQLVLNLKTEGVEQQCIDLMAEYGITNWFFIDISILYFIKYAIKAAQQEAGFGPNNLAIRFSQYEPIEYAMKFAHMAGWVFVDHFTTIPFSNTEYDQLKESGFKFCIISPELQQHSTGLIQPLKLLLKDKQIDAVCTKYPELWQS